MAPDPDASRFFAAIGQSPAGVQRPIVIGISGASCSGKTWLAKQIHQQKPDESALIDLDGYYRDLQEVAGLEHGHDNPDSIHFDRALDDLVRLKSGQAVNLPLYCYETHRVNGFRECQVRPIILLEGMFIFAHQRLREEIDIKIWMETNDELRLSRRIERDIASRDRTIDEIQERYARDVMPGYHKFIRPLREHADVIVSNNDQDANATPQIVKLVLAYVERVAQPS